MATSSKLFNVLFDKEWQIMLGLQLVLGTLHCHLKSVLSKTNEIGDT